MKCNLFEWCRFLNGWTLSLPRGWCAVFALILPSLGWAQADANSLNMDNELSLTVSVLNYNVNSYRRHKPLYRADILVGKIVSDGKYKDRVFHFLIETKDRPRDPDRLMEAIVSVFSSVMDRQVFEHPLHHENYPVKAITGVAWRP